MHAAQAHVFHGEGGTWTQRRDGRGHTQARSERGARHAGTIDRFRDEGERLVLGRLDDDVIGLGIADLEFVHRDGPDITPRTEERRVGNEWASTCRSRVSAYHSKKK